LTRAGLAFDLTSGGREQVKESDAWLALASSSRDDIDTLMSHMAATRITDRDIFLEALKRAAKATDIKLTAKLKKDVIALFGERDPEAVICTDADGNPEPDTQLRDDEQVPYEEPWQDYFAREVLPHVPDAWVNESVRDAKDGEVGIVGYEVPFNRHFYRYTPPRPLAEIDADLKELTARIGGLLGRMAG